MKPRCPHLRIIRGGDEANYLCDIVDKYCLVEYGDKCDTYDEWLDEESNEANQ